MARVARSRLRQLERRTQLGGPPLGRLLFLIPDLWPAEDQEAFHHPANQEALVDLVERRTGVRPSFGMEPPIWGITVSVPVEMLAWDDAEKAAYLDRYESRPIPPGRWEWPGDAVDDPPADA